MHPAEDTHTHITADQRATLAVHAAEHGLTRNNWAIENTAATRPQNNTGRAARASRLEELHTRRARWWAVLQRATDHRAVAFVYVHAVIAAKVAAEDDARFWRDTAADWTARALGEPTSDCAGAMSNWDELGITDLGRPHLADTVPTVPAIGAGR